MHVDQIYIKYFKERGMCYKTNPGKILKKNSLRKGNFGKKYWKKYNWHYKEISQLGFEPATTWIMQQDRATDVWATKLAEFCCLKNVSNLKRQRHWLVDVID